MEVLGKGYYSKADAFILPLTGLPNENKYELKSYLFWKDYSIENYQFILSYNYENYQELLNYLREKIFPLLDKKGYLIENYDIEGRSIFVLDLSEWAMDIQMFLAGKYSKFSKEAKTLINLYHKDIIKGIAHPVIYTALFPNTPAIKLDNKTPIEYAAEEYGLDLEELKKIGEIGSKYDRMEETLLTDIESLCTNTE